jgi:uncharacterized protein YggE
MRNIIIGCGFLMLSLGLAAKREEPTGEFTGVGQVKTKPDFIKVTFVVQSECYPAPLEATNATDEVVKKIDNYLQKLKNKGDEHFKILVDGGYTSTFSRWHKDRELCRNTFQKTTEVKLKISASDGFDKTFAQMQNYALQNFEEGLSGNLIETPRTFVRINMPEPKLTPAHNRELEKEALNLAMLDAKARFKAATQSCKEHPWKVLSIKEESTSFEPAPRNYQYASARIVAVGSPSDESNSAPIRFDDMSIEKRLSVTFEFEGSLCYQP